MFYLKPCALHTPKGDVWYSKIPVGHNTLQNKVKRLCATVGITEHFTYHSLRTTVVICLFEARMDEQLIMCRTGHKSFDGVCSYKCQTEQVSKVTSNVLNAPKQPIIALMPSQEKRKEKEVHIYPLYHYQTLQ